MPYVSILIVSYGSTTPRLLYSTYVALNSVIACDRSCRGLGGGVSASTRLDAERTRYLSVREISLGANGGGRLLVGHICLPGNAPRNMRLRSVLPTPRALPRDPCYTKYTIGENLSAVLSAAPHLGSSISPPKLWPGEKRKSNPLFSVWPTYVYITKKRK